MALKNEDESSSSSDSEMISVTPTPRQVLRLEPVSSNNPSKDVQCLINQFTTQCSSEPGVITSSVVLNHRRALAPNNRFVCTSNGRSNRRNNKLKLMKQYRRSKLHKVKKQEYNKLKEMVPALKTKDKVSKVVVIEEAIKYIDELHSALVLRFRSKEIPTVINGVKLDPREIHGGNIRDLIRHLLANANPSSLPPARIENVRTMPSFLQKLAKHKKNL